MNEINFLLNNRDIEFLSSPYSYDLEKQHVITDKFYIDFIKKYNGGFFFDKSLLIYGYTSRQEIYSLDKINEKINLEYGIISANDFFFACDIFGNQFCFDYATGKVYFFDIEIGSREIIANNFIEWIQVIESKTDYYTGQSFIIKWEEIMFPLNYDERLTPKMPFILEGEYHLNNVRVEKLGKILEFNSNIAKQIFDLPDGTPFKIKVE
jgi:hypothetical protein